MFIFHLSIQFIWFIVIYYTCKTLYHVPGRRRYRIHIFPPSIRLNKSIIFLIHTLFQYKQDELVCKLTVIVIIFKEIYCFKSLDIWSLILIIMITNVDLNLYLLVMNVTKLKHLDFKISGALLGWYHGNYIHESYNVSLDVWFCSPAGRHRGMVHDNNRHEWVWLEAWCCLNNHTITL